MDTFMPEKIAGNACGRLILKNICQRLLPMERARSIMSRSTDLKPITVETTMGKKPSMKAAITLGITPKPNQTTNSGATAILGTLCENTSKG